MKFLKVYSIVQSHTPIENRNAKVLTKAGKKRVAKRDAVQYVLENAIKSAPGGFKGEKRWIWGSIELWKDGLWFASRHGDTLHKRDQFKEARVGIKDNEFTLILRDGTELYFRTNGAKEWVSTINSLEPVPESHDQEPVRVSDDQAPSEEKKLCPFCGHLNLKASVYCAGCGKAVAKLRLSCPNCMNTFLSDKTRDVCPMCQYICQYRPNP